FIFNAVAFYTNDFVFHNNGAQQTPVLFDKSYLGLASQFGPLTTVQEGHRTQEVPIFTRMINRETNWSYNKGLKSLIPTALAMSIAGYSFIIPDIIGGRWGKADKELYIRWAQATTFMPT